MTTTIVRVIVMHFDNLSESSLLIFREMQKHEKCDKQKKTKCGDTSIEIL